MNLKRPLLLLLTSQFVFLAVASARADVWTPTSVAPKAVGGSRAQHTAVWTGEEMVVWGGHRGSGATHLGYRYNLAADVWLPVTNTGSPTNRHYHTAVWTGREMIIFAGMGGGALYGYAGATGGAYRPTCGVQVLEPQEGARVNGEVTFRLHLSPASTPRQAQLVVDGVPHGEPQTVGPDSLVRFSLGDKLTGQRKLQVRTAGADAGQCLSPETPVLVGPTVKVLRLTHDPVFESLGGLSLIQTIGKRYGWSDPEKLSDDFNKALLESSGGFANYVIAEKVTHTGHLRQANGYVGTDDHVYNAMSNCGDRGDGHYFPGWANFAGVPELSLTAPGVPRGCDDTVPNGGLLLGIDDGHLKFAQSFRAWGTGLEKIQLTLTKLGSPTSPVRVSVRKSLDGEDLCNPEGVCGVTFDPKEVPHATDPPAPAARPVHKDFKLPMEKDVLYYLVVQVSAAQDINNHYWLRTMETATGRPDFTDEESKLYHGAKEEPLRDMSAKLMFKHDLDSRHLYDVENFKIDGKSQPISAHVRDGTIDEVHTLAGPLVAMHEGVMLGPDAYGVYGEVDNVNSGHLFVAMWLNYERSLAQALESYGHRVEATMRRVYGGWSNDPYFKELPQAFPINTTWDRFTTMRAVLPSGVAVACGSVHFPPNTVKKEYDYQHMEKMASVCDQWLKYPVLSGPAKMLNATAWGCNPRTDNDDACEVKFLKWWYTHLPKVKGCNKDDGRLNNWWRYIVEPENYKTEPLPRCDAN